MNKQIQKDLQDCMTAIIECDEEIRDGFCDCARIILSKFEKYEKRNLSMAAAHRRRMAEIRDLKKQLWDVRHALGKAAAEIQCAGPVDHRIRVLKSELQAIIDKQAEEIQRLKENLLNEKH